MAAKILDGRALARRHNEETGRRIAKQRDAADRSPRFDVVLVGDDEASAIYVRNKQRAAAKIGIDAHVHQLDADIDSASLQTALRTIEADDAVDGIVLQLPLPTHIDARPLLASIEPSKDVDGFHPQNLGRVLAGLQDGFIPATPLGILWFLQDNDVGLRGAEVTIVSHSNLIGKPLAALLINLDATVTVAHVHTRDLAAHTQRADVLVTAAGAPGLIGPDHIRPGATVIDAATAVGADGSLVGDCAPDVADKAGALTPVPGGVGPVTVAALLHNVKLAWLRRIGNAE